MKVRAVIDRIEDGRLAVLEIEGEMGDFVWPVEFLPGNVHDGSILEFSIEENPQAEAAQREKMRMLRDEMLRRTREQEGEEPGT